MSISRRTFVLSSLAAGGAAMLTGCSGSPEASPLEAAGAEGAAVEPAGLGLRWQSLTTGGSKATVTGGTNALAVWWGAERPPYELESQNAVQLFFTEGPNVLRADPQTAVNQKIDDRAIAVDQHPDAAGLVVDVSYVESAGSGLNASERLLVVTPWTAEGMGKSIQVPVRQGTNESIYKLHGVGVSLGVVCVGVIYTDESGGEKFYKVEHQAFDLEGNVLWSRSDVYDTWEGPRTGVGLPTRHLLVNREGHFVFGAEGKILAADMKTGNTVWETPVPHDGVGVVVCDRDVAVLYLEHDHSHAGGLALSLATGEKLVNWSVDGAALDPVAGRLVLTPFSGEPWHVAVESPDPNPPALAVFDIASREVVYSLPYEAEETRRTLDLLAAFDGRLVLEIEGEVRVVQSLTGETEPGFEALPPTRVALGNLPILAATNWAVLEPHPSRYRDLYNAEPGIRGDAIVYSNEAISWADLQVHVKP